MVLVHSRGSLCIASLLRALLKRNSKACSQEKSLVCSCQRKPLEFVVAFEDAFSLEGFQHDAFGILQIFVDALWEKLGQAWFERFPA